VTDEEPDAGVDTNPEAAVASMVLLEAVNDGELGERHGLGCWTQDLYML